MIGSCRTCLCVPRASRERHVVKSVSDLIASADRMHTAYNSGRMDRQIVAQWLGGLGGYPTHAEHINAAAAWFKQKHVELPADELKIRDLDMLAAILKP